MRIIGLGANSPSDAGYEVANSLRFEDGSSDKLTRSTGTPDSEQIFTWSQWVKKTRGNSTYEIIQGFYNNSSNYLLVSFNQDRIDVLNYEGGTTARKITTAKFRDVSAWYHIVVAVDTTQGTANNRIKIYVNGVQETDFSTNSAPSQNANLGTNMTTTAIGVGEGGGIGYLSAYLAEVCYIDGTALDPTSFGEFDEDTNIWKPIDVSDLTFGTNGFYLDFENSGSLGADVSGNGNNFTVSNLTSIDQSTDTCTNNFATLNPLQTDHSGNTSFSEGNNKFQATTGDWVGTASTQGTNTGKWYAEFKLSTLTTSALIGVATDVYMSSRGVTDYVGFTSGLPNYAYAKYFTSGVDANKGKIFQHDQTQNTYGSNTGGSTGDIIGIALDLDNNKAYWSVNGTWENSADPSVGTNGYSIGAGTYQFGVWGYQSTSESNFGSPPFTISSGNSDGNGYGNFEYAVPSGYHALNTKNLAEYG